MIEECEINIDVPKQSTDESKGAKNKNNKCSCCRNNIGCEENQTKRELFSY